MPRLRRLIPLAFSTLLLASQAMAQQGNPCEPWPDCDPNGGGGTHVTFIETGRTIDNPMPESLPDVVHKAGCSVLTKDIGSRVSLGTSLCECEQRGSKCPKPGDPPTIEQCISSCPGNSLEVVDCRLFGTGMLVDFSIRWNNSGGVDPQIYFEVQGTQPRWIDVHDLDGQHTVLVEDVYFPVAMSYFSQITIIDADVSERPPWLFPSDPWPPAGRPAGLLSGGETENQVVTIGNHPYGGMVAQAHQELFGESPGPPNGPPCWAQP